MGNPQKHQKAAHGLNMKYIQVAFNTPVPGFFTYLNPAEAPADSGYRVEAKFGRRKMTGFVVEAVDNRPEGKFEIKGVERVIDKTPLFNEKQVELAKWISSTSFCSIGEALSAILPGGIRESKMAIADEEMADYSPRILSDEQESSLHQIINGEKDYYYLFGITGSGKTEVFLQAAQKVIEKGLSVVYLVPEIALTHQLMQDVAKRFDGKVAVLHSALTPSQRLVEWNRIRSGEAKLIIGARSAVFAPSDSIGLFIIDEEHENSYKSGSTPRYHARQVAMYRCSKNGARLVMGSATPSVEAWHLMSTGRIMRLNLTKRLSGGSLPTLEVVDMRGEERALSKQLQERIIEVHAEGKQTILFLNRKGFNYFFHCKSCGYEMRCEHCSVSLTYYKNRNRMQCHYCGYSRAPVNICPTCGSLDVGYSGFGTEMVEEELQRLFPDIRVARMDGDTVRKKGALKKLLTDFRERRIDILLGTQMVAKGLNFPGVKLVGIVLADTGLHLPDFRASERTFALITQVSGRAGRFTPDGEVLIQTFSPDADAIRMACAGELEAFYQQELTIREQLFFPPFSRVARVVFRGKDKSKVKQIAQQSGQAAGVEGVSILGPAECPISIINGNYRMQMILRGKKFNRLHHSISLLLQAFSQNRSVYIEIDMDPVSLL